MARKAVSKPFWVWERLTITVGTTAAGKAVLNPARIDLNREQGFRVDKVRHAIEWRSKTIDDGPGIVGLSWNMTAIEVEETMNADPQHSAAMEMENAERNIYPVAYIPRRTTQSGQITAVGIGFELAQSFRTFRPPSWDIPEGTQIAWWYWVPQTGVTHTTGMLIEIMAGYRGGWLSD